MNLSRRLFLMGTSALVSTAAVAPALLAKPSPIGPVQFGWSAVTNDWTRPGIEQVRHVLDAVDLRMGFTKGEKVEVARSLHRRNRR